MILYNIRYGKIGFVWGFNPVPIFKRKGYNKMEQMGLNEIREKFLSFFESKGCLRLDSFPLVPQNDASLLLINSGMAPMKKWFTGAEVPPRKRVATCQKCIRTPDIERVGKTARHGTFFEMLGNFSFGDYFKREAINWAWEFLTKEIGFDAKDLWITVYEEDDEARDIWVNEVGVSAERVVKMGKEDNFWEHGTGPCGPCSEIHVDRGAHLSCGPDCKIGCDCDRFMEVWNLVFTQFDKDEDGNYNRLANPNIDTGMGLERLAAVCQGVANLFEVDTVKNVMAHISKIAGVNYKEYEKTDVSLRVITDHIRSTVMMVSDGVIPSNEGRGYVLRRLLRRAARHGKLLNIKGEFLCDVADTVIAESKSAYPELEEKKDYIKKIIKIEEERFAETIDNGLVVLNGYIKAAKEEKRDKLSGEETFKLHDTYGFPLDLTIEIASENGLDVDVDRFTECMQEQKTIARNARKEGSSWDGTDNYNFDIKEATEFVGYGELVADAEILGIAKDGAVADTIGAGEQGVIVVDKTPFYAEMGGQVGDIGKILADEVEIKVENTTKDGNGLYYHLVTVVSGEVSVGTKVTMKVCKKRRRAIERNHSTTHLLHKALKETLGSHVAQAGSLVTPDRLRFDFSHFEAMTKEELATVEERVNAAILEGYDINIQELNIDEAKKLGATAQFGEKYGEVVRVVSMGDYSIEFCGGCHLTNTAQAGLFKIISEGAVAAGVRRIEAVTGAGVLSYMKDKEVVIADVAKALKSTEHDLVKKAESVMEELKATQKEAESAKAKLAAQKAGDILSSVRDCGSVKILAAQLDGSTPDALKTMADDIKAKVEDVVVVFAAETDGKITFVTMASKSAVEKGAHAGKIIKEITAVCGGSGGGKPDMAQGGGKDASKIADALALAEETLASQTK